MCVGATKFFPIKQKRPPAVNVNVRDAVFDQLAPTHAGPYTKFSPEVESVQRIFTTMSETQSKAIPNISTALSILCVIHEGA